jgi:itaconate CoA-transferase
MTGPGGPGATDLPLAGLTVVALEQAVAAPFATRQLADRGARVIKIERPDGGDFARGYDERVKGLSSYFVWLNRSKESLTLDIKSEIAAPALGRLLARSDVFIQNLAPGAAARLGLGAEELRSRHPRLIVCELSGYGSTGPFADRKAYDLLVQCEAGVLSVTGTPEHRVKTGISIADIAGGMYAYSAILMALYRRAVTGDGCSIEVTLFDALTEWMSHPLYFALYSGEPPARTGAAHATVFPYGSFATGDGRAVQLGIQNEREWARFCQSVIERPDLLDDPRFSNNGRRSGHREPLTQIIEHAFASKTVEEVVESLEAAQIAFARLNEVADLIAHPQLRARDRWRTVDTPHGPIDALRPPAVMHGVGERFDPIPAVGEHTDDVLAELGFDEATIADARRQQWI